LFTHLDPIFHASDDEPVIARKLISSLPRGLDRRRRSMDILRHLSNRVLIAVNDEVHATAKGKSTMAPAPHNGTRLDKIPE